ncbi:hypothetical protein EB796_015359 [Bugula neritina]|uniref:Uncharacterized protein n=1 Tax=Bugula neritina TaxID=10212 RepID=A0A7J7JL20_BUGNE|nr:hypothetical protein EB796_015359 [Bugula neritina]
MVSHWEECVYSARLHSHDSTSELYYSCIKGKYQTKLFSQLTNAAEVSSRIVLSVARRTLVLRSRQCISLLVLS